MSPNVYQLQPIATGTKNMTARRQTKTILASAARTATNQSDDFTAGRAKNSIFLLDVSSVTATPSITMTIQGKDPISGDYYTILSGAAVTTESTNLYQVGINFNSVSNQAANTMLPPTYRISVAHGDTDSITYSVSQVDLIED